MPRSSVKTGSLIVRPLDAGDDDARARVAAEPVRELVRMGDVPDREVGALAGGERAAVGEAERARARSTVMPRNASSGVSRNSVHAMFSISSGESVGDEPGLWSVAIAIGTPAARSAATGGSRVSRRK